MRKQQKLSRELDAPIGSARALIHACVSPALWRELIEKQVALAREGNKGALELLLEYGFGRPTSVPAQGEESAPPIQWIVVHKPVPSDDRKIPEDGAPVAREGVSD